MFGESGTGTSRTYRYYKCARAKKGKLCDKKAVRKEWMEEIAIQKALGVLENAELVNLLVDKLYALQGEENPRLPRLNEQMADIEKRIENMLSAIEQGIITDSTKDRLSQLEAKKKEIEITILQEKIKKPFLTKEQILFGIEKYKKLDLTTQEGKQRLIDGFINAIYVYDDRITFTYNYKDGTETITLSELESAKSSDIKCVGAPKNGTVTRLSRFFASLSCSNSCILRSSRAKAGTRNDLSYAALFMLPSLRRALSKFSRGSFPRAAPAKGQPAWRLSPHSPQDRYPASDRSRPALRSAPR